VYHARVSTRALERPILAGAALVAALVAGCGERTPAGPQETWPLTVPETGVLGYAAVDLPAAERTALLEGLLGWVPAGLADTRPLVALRLDSATFGGPVAIIAPLSDGQAFDASLRSSPHVEVTGENRYRVRLPPESKLGMLMLLAAASQATSPADVLGALQSGGDTSFPLQIERRDDVAFAVPSFEALSLCRAVSERLSGPPPAAVVLSVDLARVQTVYAQDIRTAHDQLRALISGARIGGPLLLSMQEEGGLDLPINWELVWALLEMFEARQFEAAQLCLTLDPPSGSTAETAGSPELAAAEAALERLTHVSLRVRFGEDSRLRAVVDSLRPAPSLDDAWLEAGADPAAFARAFAEWTRPIAEVVKGEGPPCDRYVDEFAALLASWDGRLALVPGPGELPLLLVGARESDVTLERWLAWLEPLLLTARIEGLPAEARPERLPDGALVLRDPLDGSIDARGRLDAGVFWLLAGDGKDPDPALLQAFREQPVPAGAAADGPALRAWLAPNRLQVSERNGELWVQLTVDEQGR
jgi:hypothetical protein